MSQFTIISDVHGKREEYLRLTKKYENTLQLGDMGFTYDHLDNIDANHHKFLNGNHDNVDLALLQPHCLGKFGKRNFAGHNFFFVSGANSIDKAYRVPGVNWWHNEELSRREMDDCLYDYGLCKPDLVITHDCPNTVCKQMMGDNKYPSNTGNLLEMMFSIHQPQLWFFGHYHFDWEMTINGIRFRCLDELKTFTLE